MPGDGPVPPSLTHKPEKGGDYDNSTDPDEYPKQPGEKAPAPAPEDTPVRPRASSVKSAITRAGVVWGAVVIALILLVLLIIFILSNQRPVSVLFLGFEGVLPLGMALFIAAVRGGILVAVAGAARIIQLRSKAKKTRKLQKTAAEPADPGSRPADNRRLRYHRHPAANK